MVLTDAQGVILYFFRKLTPLSQFSFTRDHPCATTATQCIESNILYHSIFYTITGYVPANFKKSSACILRETTHVPTVTQCVGSKFLLPEALYNVIGYLHTEFQNSTTYID